MKKLKRFLKYIAFLFILFFSSLTVLYYIPFSPSYLAEKTSQQADYYFEDEEQWMKDHTLWEIAYSKWWEFKIRKELTRNVHERFEKQTELSIVHFVAKEIQSVSITQHQRDFPVISGSATSNLIRGFGYCDQINAGLAIYLQEKSDEADLYNIYSDSNSHTLVRTKSDLGTVWLDAFGCHHVFGFPDELTEKGKKIVSVYSPSQSKVFSEHNYKEAVFFNSFSFGYTLKKGLNRVKNLFSAKTYNPDEVITFERDNSSISREIISWQENLLKDIQTSAIESKRAYLTARIYHLSGDKENALKHYSIVKEKAPDSLLGKFSESFIKRLTGEELLCSQL